LRRRRAADGVVGRADELPFPVLPRSIVPVTSCHQVAFDDVVAAVEQLDLASMYGTSGPKRTRARGSLLLP
jgi:hypothetical protein